MFYGFLQDPFCTKGAGNGIEFVPFFRGTGDSSVATISNQIGSQCVGRTVCPVSLQIDADAQILENADGSVVADLQHVHLVGVLESSSNNSLERPR